MRSLCCLVLGGVLSNAAQVWTVQVEEPTGLYRRTGEVIAVPVAKLGGKTGPFTVVDSAGREQPAQLSGGELLFPVSLMPGDRPIYRVVCCDAAAGTNFRNPIVVRRLGLSRVEFGSGIFRAIIDTRQPSRMLCRLSTFPHGSERFASPRPLPPSAGSAPVGP